MAPDEHGDIFAQRLRAIAAAAYRRALSGMSWAHQGDSYSAALAATALAVAAGVVPKHPSTAAAVAAGLGEPRPAVCKALKKTGIDSAPIQEAGELANLLADSGDDEKQQAKLAASRAREWREKFARGEWKTPAPEEWPPFLTLQEDPTVVIRDFGGSPDDDESVPWIDASECVGGGSQ